MGIGIIGNILKNMLVYIRRFLNLVEYLFERIFTYVVGVPLALLAIALNLLVAFFPIVLVILLVWATL